MKNTCTGLVAAILLAAVCSANPASAAAPDDPAATRKALDAVVERLNSLDEWFSEAERQRVRWLKDVQAKDAAVAEVAQSVETAADNLAAINSDITRLEAERAALNERRSVLAEQIGEHLAASYRMAGEDFVKLLLNQNSPDTFDRIARYHRYFTEARMEVLNSYQATLAALTENQDALEDRAEAAVERRDTLAEEQRALVRERENRKALLGELDAEIEDKTAERKRLEADRNRLQQLFAELQRRASDLDGSGFVARKASLPWPLRSRVRHAFGQSRADGRLTWHGIVIDADEGTPVKAVYRGRVVFANWLRGFGLLTIIDHGGGYMTLYGHADVLLKTVGDMVEAGEVIARAGKSGGQQSSGLYFEVRHKGVAKDPIGWLAKRS